MIHHFTRMRHASVRQTILWIYIQISVTANLTVWMIWTQHIATWTIHAWKIRDLKLTLCFFLVSFNKKFLTNCKKTLPLLYRYRYFYTDTDWFHILWNQSHSRGCICVSIYLKWSVGMWYRLFFCTRKHKDFILQLEEDWVSEED